MNSNDLEYINSFGAIFKDDVIIPKYNPKVPFKIEDIKSVVMIKKRSYFYNVLFLIVSVVINLIIIVFYFKENKLYSFISIFLFSLICAYFIKKFKYKVYIVLVHKDFEIRIEDRFKEDAKEIVLLINKALRKRNKLN